MHITQSQTLFSQQRVTSIHTVSLVIIFHPLPTPMPARAVPKQAQKYKHTRTKDRLYAEAVELYAAEQNRPLEGTGDLRRGARKIAEAITDKHKYETGENIELSHHTIIRHYNGGRTMSEFNESKAWLNSLEESYAVEYLIAVAARGFPLTHRRFEEVINAVILRRNNNPEFKGVGKRYTDRFRLRHSDEIATYWTRLIDSSRARAVNPNTLSAWFKLLEDTYSKYNIQPKDIYGADETGFGMGVGTKERVLARTGKKVQYRQRSGVRENVTVMVTICADGQTIPPLVIFKGQAFLTKWLQNNPANAV